MTAHRTPQKHELLSVPNQTPLPQITANNYTSTSLDFESLKPLLNEKKTRKAKPFPNVRSKHMYVHHKPSRVILQPPKE